MLSIESLTVGYGRRPVLSDLTLATGPGRVHGLVGRNGEGKTTLLDTIFGFHRPWSGRVTFNGGAAGARCLAYLPMESFFYPGITGREYLQIFRHRSPRWDAGAWAGVFDIPLGHYVDSYSAGMKKKLALLGVISMDRPVIMLDEPMNGLDLESNLLLRGLLQALAAQGATVLLTSHVLEAMVGVCDVVHVLAGGRISQSVESPTLAEVERHLVTRDTNQRTERMRALLAAGR